MKQVVRSTLLTLLLLVPASVLAQNDVRVYVMGSDLQTKELDIRVVEGQKTRADFVVKPESVVQVSQGENLVVFTEPPDNVDNVKITDESGRITELVNTNGDTFSLSGIVPGVYTLDVIVNLPNSDDRAAYETILVILSPGQAPVQPIEVINKVKIITEVTFEEVENDDECSNDPGSAGLPFPQDKRTECEKKVWDKCKDLRERVGGTNWISKCDKIDEIFMDNDCFGYESQKECDEAYNQDPELPICGENPDPQGGRCIDDGDLLTCEPGFIDRGRGDGCEPELVQEVCPPRCGGTEPPVEGVPKVPEPIEDDFNDDGTGGVNVEPEPEVEEVEEEDQGNDSEEEESEEESSGESDGIDSGVS
jgi:hypothetical protein